LFSLQAKLAGIAKAGARQDYSTAIADCIAQLRAIEENEHSRTEEKEARPKDLSAARWQQKNMERLLDRLGALRKSLAEAEGDLDGKRSKLKDSLREEELWNLLERRQDERRKKLALKREARTLGQLALLQELGRRKP
jgi:flagellar biosynthesis chaperone FliJ